MPTTQNKFHLPTVFIIFGATGDLMTKKIVPAFFNLFEKNKLPRLFKIIGVGRREYDAEAFRSHVTEILDHLPTPIDHGLKVSFLSLFSYHVGRFENLDDYKSLAASLGNIDGQWQVCSNKLFYVAAPPKYYSEIFSNLAKSGLTIPCGPDEGWTRVIVEKPFGKDLKTAEELDKLLSSLFKEEQIYRLDHYLGKDMLQNILSFRFANNLFEESWNNKFIEKIDIRLLETKGAEGRGAFYDGLGALRDVGQNHLLQMLALVTMENPQDMTPVYVRRERAKLLDQIRIPTTDEIKKDTFRAQYSDFLKVENVAATSTTETYFKTKLLLDSPRWQNVPIYLESGKKMPQALKEIVVTFKHKTHCLCPPGKHLQNLIVFQMEPQEKIAIKFLAKQPGLVMETEDRAFDFIYRKKAVQMQYVEEYEKLLLDCIEGNQLLFVDSQEIEAMWKYIDPIVKAWDENSVPLFKYLPGDKQISQTASEALQSKGKTYKKEVGIVGLGKMGGSLARQLLTKDYKVVGFNRSEEKTKELVKFGLLATFTLEEVVEKLTSPRTIILSLPGGAVIDEVLFGEKSLVKYLNSGDVIIDASNSYFEDAGKRYNQLAKLEVKFVDVGISGGPAGALNGACLMVGGDRRDYDFLLPLFIDLAVPQGVEYFSGVGAGHFVKMIHNGIEYGMMQALAEGFTVLAKSKYNLDLERVAQIYNHGSVIEARLVDWLKEAFEIYGQDLEEISGRVDQSGEGSWTVDTAQKLKVQTKIIEEAVKFRQLSQKNPDFTGKILSALRNRFGHHPLNPNPKP